MSLDIAEALRQFQALEQDRTHLQTLLEEERAKTKRVRQAEETAATAREHVAQLQTALAEERARVGELERVLREAKARNADLVARLTKAESIAEAVAERERAARELESMIGGAR